MEEKRRQYNLVKVAMVRKNISREEMAAHLGKTVRTMTRYMTNDVQPSIPELFKIAERCGIDARELIVSSLEPPVYIEE
jgi:putative transcriptional regulator